MTALGEKREKREEEARRWHNDLGKHQGAGAAGFFREVRLTVGWLAAIYLTGKYVASTAAETIKAIA